MPGSGEGAQRGRYRRRLVTGVLAISVPLLLLLILVLSSLGARTARDQAHRRLQTESLAVQANVERWISERTTDLRFAASSLSPVIDELSNARERNEAIAVVQGLQEASASYDVVQIHDLNGALMLSSEPDLAFDPSGQDWFDQAAAGEPSVSPLLRDGEELRWVIASPIRSTSGGLVGVVLGDLRVEALADLVAAGTGGTGETLIVNSDSQLVYSTAMGSASDGETLLEQGALETTVNTPGARRALDGAAGVGEYVDYKGVEVLSAWAPVESLGWGVIAKEPRAVALAPINRLLTTGGALALAGIAFLAIFSILFARREASYLRGIADETGRSSGDVRRNADQLSSASRQLAATTAEQTAAVTETSATMEELARAAASIADTVDRVASQAMETRDNIEEAEADVQRSSERTLVLAERVDQIRDILALINDIADQTDLLALNAAIEAARAGESGRGFGVVADEVRRLAERSKASATDIAAIVQSTQTETSATLLAMEQCGKQMREGLGLLEGVAEATAQVRLTTQQQRSAAEQVVETMGQATEASREVSTTAQEITNAAADLARLASDLEHTADATRSRF